MSDINEGLGGMIEGTLAARAVEKEAGEGRAEGQGACLNCGTALIGPHCHGCGQRAQIHRTLSALLHDIAHGVLHLDGKLWRTLPLLAFKPGELTRRYIEGERAKFVSPIAMFLFSVFLMFAVFQAVGIGAPQDLPQGAAVSGALDEARKEAIAQRDAASKALATLPASAPAAERARLERELAEAREGLDGIATVESLGAAGPVEIDANLTGIKSIDDGLIRKWRENPRLMLYKLQANAYKFSWLLIPLSVPFLWLMFAWKRGIRAYDHAIFVTYSIAFMSLLFTTLSVIGASGAGGGWVFTALAVIPPLHLYKQLRQAYGLSRFSALWRLGLLTLFIMVVIVLFLQILLLLGAA
ncbi:MAG: DUF3667 domain-containing protein [Erythrobacter sp.]